MKFHYVAYRRAEGVVKGHLEARNLAEAGASVERRGYKPLRVTTPRRFPGLEGILAGRSSVGTGELVRFARQLATMLGSGGNLLHVLEMLQRESRNKLMHRTIGSIRRSLDEGGSLSSALADHPKVFNRLFLSVVEVGEHTGRLAPALEQMADILGKEHEARQKAMRSMMYPLGIIGLSMVTLGVLMTVALPPMLKTFSQLGADVPLVTRVAVGLFSALGDHYLKVFLGLVATLVTAGMVRRIPQAKHRMDQALAKAPVVGQFIVAGELSRSCRTLAMLLEAGVTLSTALELGISGCKNLAMRRAFADAHESLMNGHSLAGALKRHPIVPGMLQELVTIGEESNSLMRTMGDAALAYQKQLEERLAALLGIMEPVSTVAVGAIVGFIAFSMFVPIYSGLNAIH